VAVPGGRRTAPCVEYREDDGWPTPLRRRPSSLDRDRRRWIETVAEWVEKRLGARENGLITCSALKRSYRDVINRHLRGVMFVYLAGSKATIAPRLAARQAHFMPSSLLDSQFADLDDLQPDEPHIRVDIGPPPGEIADGILRDLGLNHALK
jgi:gluconokinase